jgi:hypothetical protein
LTFSNLASSSNARWWRLRMKKKNAANEANKTITMGTTIAGIRVLVFELDDLWVLAVEVALAAAFAVALVVALIALPLTMLVERVLKAPAAEREENWAEFETTTGIPWSCWYVVPSETKLEVLKLVYVVKGEAAVIMLPAGVTVGRNMSDDCVSVAVATRPSTPVWVLSRGAWMALRDMSSLMWILKSQSLANWLVWGIR